MVECPAGKFQSSAGLRVSYEPAQICEQPITEDNKITSERSFDLAQAAAAMFP
jgi:hypothetical protein